MKKILSYLETQDNRMKVIYATVFLPVILSFLSVAIYDSLSEYTMWIVYLIQFIAFICWALLPVVVIYDSLIKAQRKIRNKSEKEFDGKEFNKYVAQDVDESEE